MVEILSVCGIDRNPFVTFTLPDSENLWRARKYAGVFRQTDGRGFGGSLY